MNYKEAVDFIHSSLKFGSKPGFDRILKLLEHFGNPHKHLKYIHIAGTNGKGSTSTMCSYILANAGYKTGLYISPYVLNFRERFQIDNEMISEEELIELVLLFKPIIKQMNEAGDCPTEFEIITAMAFYWFYKKGCDIVCLEVGLGGRLDATNIIENSLVSVITSISFDHTEILGKTIDQIAFEKCGIMKPGGTTVCYPAQDDEALSMIMMRSALTNNTLVIPNFGAVEIINNELFNMTVQYGELHLKIALLGEHQIKNAITAVEAIRVVQKQGFHITNEDIEEGIKNTRFPARQEVLCSNPLVVLDGAHNYSGAQTLENTLKKLTDKKIVVMMGMLADKDYRNAVSIIAPFAEKFIAVKPDNPRALSPESLAEIAYSYCENCVSFEDYDEAIENAYEDMDENSALIICGSLYLANAVREKIIDKFNR